MSRNDIKNHIDVVSTITPGNYQATETGTNCDLANFDATAVVFDVGTVTADDFTFAIQHADDDGSGSPDTYAAVSASDLDGTIPTPTTTADEAITVVGYHGIKRWLRVVATDGGTANADFSVTVVRAKGRVKP